LLAAACRTSKTGVIRIVRIASPETLGGAIVERDSHACSLPGVFIIGVVDKFLPCPIPSALPLDDFIRALMSGVDWDGQSAGSATYTDEAGAAAFEANPPDVTGKIVQFRPN